MSRYVLKQRAIVATQPKSANPVNPVERAMAMQVHACCISGSTALMVSGLPVKLTARGSPIASSSSSCFSDPLSKSGRSFESREYAIGEVRRARVGKRGGAVLVRAGSGRPSVHKRTVKELWLDFFSDPSQWWDNRCEKSIQTYPDFKHKKTQESLWLNNKSNPPWVEIELAAMLPGPIQLNLFSWNKKLKACTKTGQYEKTLELFYQMQCEGIGPDKFSFVPVFNACANLRALDEGRHVHSKSIEVGCDSDIFVGNSLIDMYAKCGKVDDAWTVFSKMPSRDVVSWNAMIQGYVKCGQPQQALDLSRQMQGHGLAPNAITFVGLLNACASLAALEEGRYLHEQILQSGCDRNIFVGNSLIDMYAKCGSMNDATRVFQTIPTRTVVAWSTMIHGHVKCGHGQKALKVYKQMQREGVEPNTVTFAGVLNACASLNALEEGRLVHREIIQKGVNLDTFVGNSLVDMYAKCGSIEDAWEVFRNMPDLTEVSWNAMILGFVKCGLGQRALELSRKMQNEGVEPNEITFVGMLKACVSVIELEEDRHCQEQIAQCGGKSSDSVEKSLVRMYVKCGNNADSWRLFNEICTRNAVHWNAICDDGVKSGLVQKTLRVCRRMQREGVDSDSLTFKGLPRAHATVDALVEGKNIHEQIIQRGFEWNTVISTCLVDMYAKCGRIEDAWSVFNAMPTRDVVAWSSIIQGHVKWGKGRKALALSRQMQQEGIELDRIAFAAVLSACASATAIGEGRLIHEQIIQRGWESDVFLGSSLVDMYAKCGSIEDAWRVFDKMHSRTVVAWSAIILGYMKCAQQEKAAHLFQQMQRERVEPDLVSFAGLLNVYGNMAGG